MVKYTISIPEKIDEKITKIAQEKGITNNNEIRDTVIAYYSQAVPDFSYSDAMCELEEELARRAKDMTDEDGWSFRLADLDFFRKVERVGSGFKPSALKATIGKTFYKKVMKPDSELYRHISYEGTKQRIATYRLSKWDEEN